MGQHGDDQRLGVGPDGPGLALEPLGGPFGVSPMGAGHVVRLRAMARTAVAAGMRRHQLATVEHLDRAHGGPCVDLLTGTPHDDQAERSP